MKKLAHYVLSNNSLSLMKSYLSQWSQYLVYNGEKSDSVPINIGVPQGSILGPLLFIIYVNDIPNASNLLNSILFADDTSLYSSLSIFTVGNQTNVDKINLELDKVYDWLCVNKLSLNVSKTKFMIFENNFVPPLIAKPKLKINGIVLKQVTEFDFLGVTIDSKLTWEAHTKKIASKISRTLGVLKKIKRVAPHSVLRTLYNSLILTRLNYGIKAWGFAHQSLFKIQKKAVRIITNSKYNAHTDPIFKKLNLLKIEDIFHVSCLSLYYSIHRPDVKPAPEFFKTIIVTNRDVHGHNTRHHQIRDQETNYLSSRKCLRHFLPTILPTYHEILNKIPTVTIQTFKKSVKDFCIKGYYEVCPLWSCTVCGRNTLL